ncbi:hypothetical protein DFR58_12236 [Anaerobacterium chartisolvens]|uniref:Uncharacterized protein n=1 Tax=Anaerobacterium chartisolvens TaxID=1297424 RepID=A0A369AVV5_9FIRM|nr:hypothetical protein [Anaerobacterium chartisolvens]RCX12347.1 hypothetical protein DFR58_12236 [Anaerobacterium chartisolvens]
MLIETSITIAYRCSSCGSFEFFYLPLFKLFGDRHYHAACRCGKSGITITHENLGQNNYKIKLGCIGCGMDHALELKRRELLKNKLNVFYCPHTGIQICFIGNDESVRNKVDSVEREYDSLIDKLGYDDYFENTRVMLDSLNLIHDIAESGNLGCECGNKDIELNLLSDKISLSCKKCSGFITIQASSNEDLKNVLSAKKIILKAKLKDCGNQNPS